jgi:TonB family protein
MAGMFVRAPELRAQEKEHRQVKKQVSPLFPPLARQAGLVGTVKIEVVIAPDGKVKSARAVGGSPVFITAALEAAKQWTFEPASKETIQVMEFRFTGPPQ